LFNAMTTRHWVSLSKLKSLSFSIFTISIINKLNHSDLLFQHDTLAQDLENVLGTTQLYVLPITTHLEEIRNLSNNAMTFPNDGMVSEHNIQNIVSESI
jgi:hypothetical protein